MSDPKTEALETKAEPAKAKARKAPKASEWGDWGQPVLVVAASTAAVLGARALLAPHAQRAPEPAPARAETPELAPPAPSAPAPRAESHMMFAAGAGAPAAAPAAAGRGLDRLGGRAIPSWAAEAPSQEWFWPTTLHAAPSFTRVAPEIGAETRRLAGWFPEGAPGRRVQYAFINADGAETHREFLGGGGAAGPAPFSGPGRPDPSTLPLTEGFGGGIVAGVRRQELQTLAAAKGATSAKGYLTASGMPVAKFTYADGREEVAYYDPLVFDLIGRGVKTSSRKVLFDLYGYGRADKIQGMNDIEEGAGVLVFDATHSGKSGKDGREVLGDRTALYGGLPEGFADGFSALRGLVDKGIREGVLPASVAASGVLQEDSLLALEKAYGLKMRVGGLHGRTMTLAQAGVRGISLSNRPTERIEDFDGRGNALMVQPGAVFLRSDGSVGSYMNIWLTAKLGDLGLK